jgi:hypothetical protein
MHQMSTPQRYKKFQVIHNLIPYWLLPLWLDISKVLQTREKCDTLARQSGNNQHPITCTRGTQLPEMDSDPGQKTIEIILALSALRTRAYQAHSPRVTLRSLDFLFANDAWHGVWL